MNVTEQKRMSYELHHSGVITTVTRAELVADDGTVLSVRTTRVPFHPVARQAQKKGPVKVVDTDLSGHADEQLKTLAGLWWTPAVVAAHRAREESSIAAEQEALKRAKAGT